MHETFVLKYTWYPYKLIELLSKDLFTQHTAVAELLTAPSCTLDEYTASILSKWPDHESLVSNDCQSHIALVLGQIMATTFSTERLHSRTGRLSKHRHMTHPASLEELALTCVADGHPRWARALVHGVHSRKNGENAVEAAAKQTHDGDEKVKQRKKKGGGGAWRAYLHMAAQRDSAQKGRLNFKVLAERYQALSEEEREQLASMGREAAEIHKTGGHSFPKTHKAVAKEQRRQARGSHNLEDHPGSASLLPAFLDSSISAGRRLSCPGEAQGSLGQGHHSSLALSNSSSETSKHKVPAQLSTVKDMRELPKP